MSRTALAPSSCGLDSVEVRVAVHLLMRMASLPMPCTRVDWVDYARGICIVLVVMMHSTLAYGERAGEGWLHHAVQFAQPFRMPDFFLISGLFLSRSIDVPLRGYVDRKVLHFLYFYALWLAIQLGVTEFTRLVTEPGALLRSYLFAFLQPINTLWFVHLLPIFFIVTRVMRRVPAPVLLVAAAALQTTHAAGWINTGWLVLDQFSSRYVFFVVGFAGARWIFLLAGGAARHARLTGVVLLVWVTVNGTIAREALHLAPGISLATGLMGAAAVVGVSALLARAGGLRLLRHAGAHSLVVYLTFVFPMAAGIKVLAATRLVPDVGTACVLITACAVVLPLLFHRVVRHTPLVALYERPAALRLRPGRGGAGRILPVGGPVPEVS